MEKPARILGGGALVLAAAGLFLLTPSCSGLRPAGSPPPAHAPAGRLTLPGADNAGRVAEGLYRGAQPTREGLAALKATLGVRTIVNLRHFHSGDEEEACRALGLAYIHYPTESSDAPTDEEVRAFLKTVTDPALRPLYFHCAHGKDRTGTMCACYRMSIEGWDLDSALAEMDAFGFRTMWRDLRAYVEGFPVRAKALKP